MKLLILDWGAYTQFDINATLAKHKVTFKLLSYCFGDKSEDEFFTCRFNSYLKADSYDAVFTVNYFPLIAKVCHQNAILYLSWSYDNPLNVTDIEQTLGHQTNFVFLFDRIQTENYHRKGFTNVHHLPLAVNPDRLLLITPSRDDILRFASDISFVGKLYTSTFPEITAPLSDYDKGYLTSIVEAQLAIYGCYFIDDLLSDELVRRLNNQYSQKLNSTSFSLTKEQLSYSMATSVTHKERLMLLHLLSHHHALSLYSREKHPLLSAASYKGNVRYYKEMPHVFKLSKINLNITLKMLQSGIPLRAMDILGCGGFLLSNHQPELSEYFVSGTDFVEYENISDAVEKADFYLSHEQTRKKIALSGMGKVSSHFSYSQQMSKIFKTAGIS